MLTELIPILATGVPIALWTAFMSVMMARRDSRQKIALLEAKLRAASDAKRAAMYAADDHNREHHREDGNRFNFPVTGWQDMPTETTTQWAEIFRR